MRRYELSLAENYVSQWGLVEAIREIFQNALDQESIAAKDVDKVYDNVTDEYVPGENPNKMFYEFSQVYANRMMLRIGNKASTLSVESLLMGETTKAEDTATIGKFGEGYKLALLVLTRLGKNVKIFNYGAREVWNAKLRSSKKFNGAKTLQIEVEDKFFWQNVPDNNLVYEIGPISEEEHVQIVNSNLNLQDMSLGETLDTSYGKILLEDEYKGKVYVNGLFISDVENLQYGYNFKPEHIELDRDRRMIQQFDLQWRTSGMWKETGSMRILDMVKCNAIDIAYIKNAYSYSGRSFKEYRNIADNAFTELLQVYGDKAYPVTSQKEMEDILRKRGGPDLVKPIVVHQVHKDLMESSELFKKATAELPPMPTYKSPAALMWDFYNEVRDKLDGDDLNMLWTLSLISTHWRDIR